MRLVFSLLTHGRGFEVVVAQHSVILFRAANSAAREGSQSGGHLHHVHADDVEAVKKALQQVQKLPGGEAAELGRAGTGGIGGSRQSISRVI